jgi:hypothetical protein
MELRLSQACKLLEEADSLVLRQIFQSVPCHIAGSKARGKLGTRDGHPELTEALSRGCDGILRCFGHRFARAGENWEKED